MWQNEQLGIKQYLYSETKKLKCRLAKNRAAFRSIQFPFSEHGYGGWLCWGRVLCGEESPAASPALWSGVCRRMAEPSHTWKPCQGLCRRHKTLRCRREKWNSQENVHCRAVTAGALCLANHPISRGSHVVPAAAITLGWLPAVPVFSHMQWGYVFLLI